MFVGVGMIIDDNCKIEAVKQLEVTTLSFAFGIRIHIKKSMENMFKYINHTYKMPDDFIPNHKLQIRIITLQ